MLLAILCGLAVAAVRPAGLECNARQSPIDVESARPRLSWVLESADRDQRQSAWQVQVGSTAGAADMWDSGKVASAANYAVYAGKPLVSHGRYSWRVRVWDGEGTASDWSAPAEWTAALLAPDGWTAGWIAIPDARLTSGPMPLFRKEAEVRAGLKRALVHVAGLGFYELRINGRRVGDREFAPGWTNYRASVLYDTYDVTSMLAAGRNALGVMLGNGFFNVVGGRYTKYTASFGRPKLGLELHLEYADGARQKVVTDSSWKAALGPITFSCVYGGEDHDARLEPEGWDRAGFDDSKWLRAAGADQHTTSTRAHTAPPIRVWKRFPTVKVSEPRPGVKVYDLGQNMAGRPRVRVSGTAGSFVKLTPGELLAADGTVSQRSSGGPMWFTYTLKGAGVEEWAPRFTYYGFRYVQVEGTAKVERIEGEFIHADAPPVGTFESSSTLMNRIHKLVDMAVRSNLQSVLTDCPHREKLGWLEVAHLMGPSLMYNYDLRTFYEKITRDMSEAQLANGLVPDIAPEYVIFRGGFRDSPEWGSAFVSVPWQYKQWYGDDSLIREHYAGMGRYVEYLQSKARDGVLSHGLGDWYDIGPRGPGESQLTPRGLTATAMLYHNYDVLARTAATPADAQKFRSEAKSTYDAFKRAFWNAETRSYGKGSQTAQAMPLVLGLVPAEARADVFKRLAADIESRGYQQTAGDVGYRFLIRALLDAGRSDLLWKINNRTAPPSYGAQLAAGATTLTEAWDANPASSQNHCMLGHVEEWLYAGLGGIRTVDGAMGFEKFELAPEPVGDLEWVKCSYRSVRGLIVSDWKWVGRDFVYRVKIPAGTRASVRMPGSAAREVGSGEYEFVARGVR